MSLSPHTRSDEEEGYCDMMQTEIPATSRYDWGSSPDRPYLCSPPWPLGGQLQSALPGKMTAYEFMYIHSLAENYLQYVLQAPAFESVSSKTSRVLQRVAFSVQKEVEKKLKPFLDDFHVDSIDTARIIFNQVMEKEFEDGIINWGRIVTIFAFGGVLLKKLPQEQIALDVDAYKQVSSFVAEFIMNNTGEWIRQNGGWVIAHSQYQNSKRISIFLSMQDEIETEEIIKDIFKQGKICFIPRYQFQSNHMDMVRLASPEEIALLPKTSWNIHQPGEGDVREEALSTGGLDLIFLPGLGFDKDGNRLGRGKGYYDTYLKRCVQHQEVKPYTMALAFKEQMCPQVPVDEHDMKVDEVLYEDSPAS